MRIHYLPWGRQVDAVCQLWNQEVGSHFPMRESLFQKNSMDDPNLLHDGSWIAWDETADRLAGFVISKSWQDEIVQQAAIWHDPQTGWIQALLVHHDYRGQGIGSELIKRAEQALRRTGVARIRLGSDLYHYFPGIPRDFTQAAEWFGRRGYRLGMEQHDLLADFTDLPDTPMPALSGATLRLMVPYDREAFLSFLRESFPGRWEYEGHRYFADGGSGREFLLLEKDRELIGFCRLNDAHSPVIAQNMYWSPLFGGAVGGIGPLGISEAARGSGYGLAIVQAAVHVLQKRGIRQIVIDWTEHVDFYAKLGFGVWKSYVLADKEWQIIEDTTN
ncbi:GNAT family N-acetyltransferase [Brevibacillus dissolubilis]|uniref:GNAT family N-acetyltransferase n=1 Tax=Brevibacillus dissolubilis TaxID=1844116 RepID=UPI00111672FF|nr:GNAT family N-acetyltransferase [Brevibacillus dissolubilis]